LLSLSSLFTCMVFVGGGAFFFDGMFDL
jgi:hypothetical protein